MHAVTNNTVPNLNIGLIDTASDIISATKKVTTIDQSSVRYKYTLYLVRLVFYHRIITTRQVVFGRNCDRISRIAVAYVAVVQGEVCLAKHGTTLTTTIGITLDGWQAVVDTIIVNSCLAIHLP